MKKRLLCVILLLLMVTGTIPVSAKTKSEKINDYLETSFDVYNVPIVNSIIEFKELMADEDVKTAIQDTSKANNSYTIKAKKNGCLVIDSLTVIDFYDVSTKNTKEIVKDRTGYLLIPLRKNDTISIKKHYSSDDVTIYVGFIPQEKTYNIDQSTKNANGTLEFVFGNVYKNDTVLSVYAAKTIYSTTEILAKDVLFAPYLKKGFTYDFTSVSEGEDGILTLPERGEYTVTVRLSMNDDSIAYDTFILDTDNYIEPTLDLLEEPLSAVAGTNIVVGYAEPFNSVFVEYDGKKYEGKANRSGIYKIVLKKDMKEGVSFKIWQSNDKDLSSKKAKYRVTGIE